MSASCVEGAFAQFLLKRGPGDVDFSSGATRLPFYRESLQAIDTVGVPDVIVGTRTEPSERARRGPIFVGGQILVPVSPVELDTYLPLILGADEATNVFAVAETVPTFAVLMDKVSKKFKYKDGVINRATFRGAQAGPGQPPNFILLALDCLFKDEDDETSHVVPSLSLGSAAGYSPYTFEDSTGEVKIATVAKEPMAWMIVIHNHINQRYVNSLNAVTNCPTRRSVFVQLSVAADTDHIGLRKVATAGVAGTIKLTNGSLSTLFTFPCLQAPRKAPFVTGKTELKFDVNFVARGLGTDKEIVVTNVSS